MPARGVHVGIGHAELVVLLKRLLPENRTLRRILLGNATIENGAVIDALALFGGVDIKLPENVNVETSTLPIFGGTGIAKNRTFNENNPTVYVNAVCIFGGVDIK